VLLINLSFGVYPLILTISPFGWYSSWSCIGLELSSLVDMEVKEMVLPSDKFWVELISSDGCRRLKELNRQQRSRRLTHLWLALWLPRLLWKGIFSIIQGAAKRPKSVAAYSYIYNDWSNNGWSDDYSDDWSNGWSSSSDSSHSKPTPTQVYNFPTTLSNDNIYCRMIISMIGQRWRRMM